ncbi:site-specific integrase [Salinilacihabitans rarus]|uniref:site-specific integrase n=1 Tax=Salinilacihabitans rarus TaxID=2961596 RepID=UPI0020C8A4AF|nr:site-specific integrase [Salinilacihabitans rarus]
MREHTLEPITPQEAKETYLDERENARYATRRTIEDVVELFVEWTEEDGIENMNNIRGRQLRQFKNWCQNTSDNNTVSLNGIMSAVRRFLVYCVEIEAVYPSVPNKTPIPNVPDDEDVSDEKPSDELVEAALDYLETHEPCSRRHVEYRLIKELGNRVGAIRAIDVRDVDVEEQVIRLRHRPERGFPDERGTPLKNGTDGQRHQNISRGLAELIRRYLNSPQRHDVEDKFGRKPLLTTENGRPEITTIRRDLYKLTRPCEFSGECPYDRSIDTCKATKSRYASDCPSSHSPHPLRRWSIEHQIESGEPKDHLADRVDVSVPVLNKHYDRRSEERKRKHRLEVLEKIFDGYGDPEATIDAGELVEMFLNSDGTVDTEALVEYNADREDSASTESKAEETETAKEQSEQGTEESPPEDQATFDRFSDGFTSPLHPVLVPVFAGIAASGQMLRRLRREFGALTSSPGTALRPSRGRVLKGATAYTLFVGLIAFNLVNLGLVPSGVL